MRFIQQDTYLGEIQKPLSRNLYTYVEGNPLMYTDPTGHWKFYLQNGKRIAYAETGDTLSELSLYMLGSASKWRQLGYYGKPENLQVGDPIDVTKIFIQNGYQDQYKKPSVNDSSKRNINGSDKNNKSGWANSGWYWRDDGLLQSPEGVILVGAQWAINNGYYWMQNGWYHTPNGVMPPPPIGQLSKEAIEKNNEALRLISQEIKNEEKLNLIQTGLDVAGMIPVIGEPIDGLNAAIYWARGDEVNAALSGASMLPIAGWVTEGGKLVKKSIKVIAKYGDDAFVGLKLQVKKLIML